MTDELPIAATTVVLRSSDHGVQTLMLRRPAAGSFGGAWVFPGGRVEPDDHGAGASEIVIAERAAERETREELGIAVRDLVPLSCWTPPPSAPARYRTWFFVTATAEGDITAQVSEVDEWAWFSPQEAIDAHAAGRMRLFPPTFVTLVGLAAHSTVASILDSISEPEYFAPIVDGVIGQGALLLHGDQAYDPPGTGTHRVRMDGNDWEYLRS